MIYTQEQAKAFIVETIGLDKKMSLNDFMTNFLKRFYRDANFEFKDQFLEWATFENANQFIIPHEKLFEYGITVDAQSQSSKKRIEALDLVEGVDYRLRKFSEPVKQGGFVKKNQYLFTPDAFKLMLMSATKHKNHTVDVSIYRKYYLMLEKVVQYYREFQFEVVEQERRITRERLSRANAQMFDRDCRLFDKDSKIDNLEKIMKEQTDLLKSVQLENEFRMRRLLMHAEDTTDRLVVVQNDLTETKEQVTMAKTYLEDKSYTSTMNPTNESLIHYFVATKYKENTGDQVVKFTSGQKSYVEKTLRDLVQKKGHAIAIHPFYNANGIDMRQNCPEEFTKRRNEIVKAVNLARLTKYESEYAALSAEIKAHNKTKGSTKRSISTEKPPKPAKMLVRDIPVSFNKTSFSYTQNDYMSFEEVLQIVKDVNSITQTSPLSSDASSGEE